MSTAVTFDTSALVSIAIPTFDRLDYLKEAVASALAQTYHNVEVLIGDDGPTGVIQAWCRGAVSRDARVRYQRNHKNLGLAGNWNALADSARGEFLVIIGDDDRLLPDFVGKLLAAIRPAAQVAFANHYLIDSRGARLGAESYQHTRLYHRDRLPAGEVANAAICVWRKSIPLSATLMHTRDIQRLRFKEDVNIPEIETFALLAQEGARFVFVPEYLSEYRTHAQSYTATGLTSEKLVKYMLPIPVSPEVEPYKREFMSALLVNAVSRCLQQGEREMARQFLANEYYPRPQWKKLFRHGRSAATTQATPDAGRSDVLYDALVSWAQGACARLPAPFDRRVYRLIQRAKAAVL